MELSPMLACGPFADITVSIVTYNSQDVIGDCLKSLPEGVAVRVFDNASSDRTVELIHSQFPAVQLVASDENVGFGCGHNANLEQIATPYSLVLNPDCFLNATALTEMVSILRGHSNVALVGPGDGETAVQADSYQDMETDEPNPHHVEQLSGHCLLMRMSAFDEIGFFDPNLFLFYEDTDLCTKTRLSGHILVLAPNTGVTHLIGQSTPTTRKTTNARDFHLGWSEAYYRCKYRGDSARLTELFRAAFKHFRKAFVRLLRLSPKTVESLFRIRGVIDYAVRGPVPSAVQELAEAGGVSEARKAA
jgi:N-acetylglucosaminyl-diphospho-decaprenol L-rhamnosyltransferase